MSSGCKFLIVYMCQGYKNWPAVDKVIAKNYQAYFFGPPCILGLQLTDCSAFHHCNHWIFDAAIDLAKNFLGQAVPKFGGEVPPPPKRCLDKTLLETFLSDCASRERAHKRDKVNWTTLQIASGIRFYESRDREFRVLRLRIRLVV